MSPPLALGASVRPFPSQRGDVGAGGAGSCPRDLHPSLPTAEPFSASPRPGRINPASAPAFQPQAAKSPLVLKPSTSQAL